MLSGFFKSVFGQQVTKSTHLSLRDDVPLTEERLQGISFTDLMSLLQSNSSSQLPYKTVQAIIQRSYRIALFDNHVPKEHRDAASSIADALTQDLAAMLADQPEMLAALRAIKPRMFELARQGGCGSLMWRIAEFSIPPASTISYIMKPEHRHLVPSYFEALPQVLASYKNLFVRELIIQSSYKSRNAVLILHGLVAKGDKAAAVLFTSEEYRSLLSVPEEYDEGRGVLVGLGLLPAVSGTMRFKPVSELNGGLASTLRDILKEQLDNAETDPRLRTLAHDNKNAILLALIFLRIELARAVLCQIYGEQSGYDVVTLYSNSTMIEQLSQFSKIAQILKGMAPGTPVDFALLDAVMSSGGMEAKSENDFNSNREFFDLAVPWVNEERVEFLDALRATLRHGYAAEAGLKQRSSATYPSAPLHQLPFCLLKYGSSSSESLTDTSLTRCNWRVTNSDAAKSNKATLKPSSPYPLLYAIPSNPASLNVSAMTCVAT